jgi:hypothetical protein
VTIGKSSNTINIWDDAIESSAPDYDAGTEEFKTTIDNLLLQFSSHKETLLFLLRNSCDGNTKAAPFDADKLWSRVETLARNYYAEELVKREIMPNAERVARCRNIATILERARAMIDDAMRAPDLADDLILGWWGGTSESAEAWAEVRDVEPLYIKRQFEKLLEGLAALESGAVRAADGAHKGRGRPRGTSVLPLYYIIALAAVYRSSTGSKPGAGDGPFAKFVMEFLAALRRNIEYESVIDAIKDARALLFQDGEIALSAFDE